MELQTSNNFFGEVIISTPIISSASGLYNFWHISSLTFIASRWIKPITSVGKEYHLSDGLAAIRYPTDAIKGRRISRRVIFSILFMILRITSQSQLCPNGHKIIIKNIFLPVSYCLLTETLSNYNWVTIRQSCGVSERTTKEKKKTLKKWKLVLFKYLTMKSKALAPRQHVLPPTIRPEIRKVIRTIWKNIC